MPSKKDHDYSVLRCKVKPKSDEEIALNYLSMRQRSAHKTITVQDLLDLSPLRFETIKRSQKILDNLVAYKYAQVDSNGNYCMTKLGLTIPYILAEYRRTKNSKLSEKD